MNILQSSVLKQYHQIRNKDSYQSIASETGIQITRLFRLFNGLPMKLSEYITIKQLVDQDPARVAVTAALTQMTGDCQTQLKEKELEKLKFAIKEKLASAASSSLYFIQR